MRAIVAILLIFSVWAADKDDKDDKTGSECDSEDLSNWEIGYVGKSTKFEYYSTCEADKLFIRVTMLSLQELDSNGEKAKNKESSFTSGANDDWGTPGEQQCGGVSALTNTFTSTTKDLGLDFSLKTCLFKADGTIDITYDNGTTVQQTVEKFMVKWDFDISSFPFENEENTLEMCLEVETKSKLAKKEDKNDDKDKNRKTFLKLGGYMDFTAPEIYSCGGVEKTVKVNFDTKKDATKIQICFELENCDGKIEYDPFVLYNTANTMNIVKCILLVLFCTLIV